MQQILDGSALTEDHTFSTIAKLLHLSDVQIVYLMPEVLNLQIFVFKVYLRIREEGNVKPQRLFRRQVYIAECASSQAVHEDMIVLQSCSADRRS